MTASDLHAREQAVIHLARGLTTDEAGELIGKSGRTVRRWLQEPAFEAQVSQARRALLAEAVAALGAVVRDSVTVLGAALNDPSPAIRVRAALGSLGALPALRSHVEFDERLAALESDAQPAVAEAKADMMLRALEAGLAEHGITGPEATAIKEATGHHLRLARSA